LIALNMAQRSTPARAIALLAAALGLCTALPAPAEPVSVRDDAGQVIHLPGPARRVVALSPHLTELVFAAGAGDRLVGVMRYSDYPAAAQALPVVGDAFAVNLEAVARLKPDLLLVWRSGMNPRQQERLRSLGVPVFESESTTVDGIADTLRRLGRLLGSADRAEAEAVRTETRWQALRARYSHRTPVRVFYQLWHEPLMTVSQGHLIDQAISACGGLNVFAHQPTLAPTVSWEAAVATNPQIVVTAAARDEPPHLEPWLRFPKVEAVRRQQLKVVDGHRLARMTPRFVDGAENLCEVIDKLR
jgi:iron complex transport system substrate-binding protein